MQQIMATTLKGIVRDRIFYGIFLSCLVILAVPSVSTLSMRQVPELSITLSLSFSSFILLLLTTFLGSTILWKDIERRYTYSTLTLPLSRSAYLFGKFFGVVVFMLLCVLFLGLTTCAVVKFVTLAFPPDRPVHWGTIWLSVTFDVLKYILLASFAFLFSTFSTSFFLPIFSTVAIFLVGSASQGAYEFVRSSASQNLSPIAKQLATVFYYIVPNFRAFDLKVYAIYSLDIPAKDLLVTAGYWLAYVSINLSLAAIIFNKREIK